MMITSIKTKLTSAEIWPRVSANTMMSFLISGSFVVGVQASHRPQWFKRKGVIPAQSDI